MDYISDLQDLVSEWLERMGDSTQPIPYRDALNECVYDLNNVIEKALQEEYDYQQALAEAAADHYISSMEAYEIA